MNAPVLLAQLSGSSPDSSAISKPLKLAKPQSGQAVTVHLDGATKIDFSAISSEKLTFVRIGDRLIILFDNQSTVSIDPVFSNTGAPLPEVSFDMGLDRVLNGTAFAELFPITTDQSVLPAAGTPGAPSSPSGANFGSFTIDALSGGTPLDLLGAEAAGTQAVANQQTATSTPIPGGADTIILNEDGLFEGQPGGLGDTGGTLTSFTGSLNIDFGTDVIGRSLAFAAAQPGLAGLTSGGQAVNLQFTTIDGQPVLIGYTGSDPSVTANQVFIVSLDVNSTIQGSYTVTLLRPLDHPIGGTEDTLNLTIAVIATDGSGDSAPLSIVIGVNDDSPVASTVASTTLVEQTGEGNTFVSSAVTASLGIGWGADSGNSSIDGGSSGAVALGDRSLVFADSTLAALASLGLTSNGEAISYALSADGTSIVASAAGGRAVFTVALSDTDSGSYTFTLLDNLDHVGANGATQPLTFAVVATDADGDPVASSFIVDITDDTPVANPGTASTVEDESLPGGNNEGDGLLAAVSGVSLNIDWNSDDANSNAGQPGDRSVAFTDADVTVSGAYGETLTSLGQVVRFTVLSTGELVGYTGESVPTSTGAANVVLFASLSDINNGEYSFTLVKPLDHAAGSDENTLSLTFNYTATDSDGDSSSNSFTVSVVDDVPVVGTPYQDGVVEEEQPIVVGAGNEDFGGAGDADGGITVVGVPIVLNDRTTQSTGGTLAIAWGADDANDGNGQPGDRAVAFTVEGIAALEAQQLTSRGQDIHYKVFTVNGGQVLVAYTGSTEPTSVPSNTNAAIAANVVFTVSLSDSGSGSYQFTLIDTIDHPGEVQGEESLALQFQFTATDSDGDTTAPASFSVKVIDDSPVAVGTILTRTVEEEQLAGGNEDTRGTGDGDFTLFGFADVTTASAGGPLNIFWGGDDSNVGGSNGYAGTQVAGDRSIVFGGSAGAYVADGVISAAVAAQFIGVSGGNGAINLADLTSGGQALVYTLSANGTVLTATAGNQTVFTVTLSDQGSGGAYLFNLSGVLDHPVSGSSASQEDALSFTFTFTARDGDGDIARSSFTVNVVDDSPVANTGTASRVEDESLAGGNNETEAPNLGASVSNVSLNIAWGADSANDGDGQPGDRSVAFSNANVAVSGAYQGTTLTSRGVAVHTTVLWDGTLVGYTGPTAPTSTSASNVVFFATLSDADSGAYSFTLVKPLDHAAGNGENTLALTFNYTATDSDGDTASNSFTVSIVDDAPVIGTPFQGGVVEEEQWIVVGPGNEDTSGAADGDYWGSFFGIPYFVDATTETTGGTLAIAWGADNANDNNGQPGDRTVSFTAAGIADLQAQLLTSRGETIHYKVFTLNGAEVLVAYTGDTPPSAVPWSTGAAIAANVVFIVGLSDSGNGSYAFTLIDTIDHPGAVQGEDALPLTFGFAATDSDGDTVTSSFTVKIVDDAPVIGRPDDETVREVDLPTTNYDTTHPDYPTSTVQTGDLDISWGADDNNSGAISNRSVAFTTAAGATGLTSDGSPISYSISADGTTLTAVTADSRVVFTVQLSDSGDGRYTFTLFDNIDHPSSGPNDDSLPLTFGFQATDGDGDTATSSFTVTIRDDEPTVGPNTTVRLDDDTLGGNPGGNGDDADAIAKTGTLVHNGGADGTASVLWSTAGLTLPSGFWFEVSADGTVMTITQDQGNGYVPVLTMTITNTTTGAYSVAQVAPIDHPQGTMPGYEDNVQFTVSYIVTDGDGDIKTGTISVNVDDDTPTVGANALIQLDDDALPGGNAGGVGDDVEATVLTGVLSHSGGADGTASVLWAPNGLTLPFGFWFTLSPDSKTMTITQLQDGTYVGVFQATITDTATGAYQITPLAAVRHNTPGIEDNVEISFQYRVTDGDGDVATGTLSINVDDDTATIGAIATRTVTELTASGFSNAFQAQSLSEVSLNISWGADDANPTAGAGAGDRSIAFAASLANAVPAGVTSNGFDLVYLLSADGQTLTAYRYENGHYLNGAGGDLGSAPSTGARVFSVSLSDSGSGSYSFTLYDNLDHASGAGANTLPLNFGFTATDSDGDATSGSFTVAVTDDVPVATGAPDLGAVTEVALDGGLSLTTGALNIDWNADDFGGRHLEFVTSGGNPVITPGLTSDGVPLVYVVRAASNGFDQELIAYKTGDAQIDSNAVFIIALNSPSNPTYVFTLYQNLDHTGVNGTTLPVTFEVRGVDGDGDTVDQTVTVNVADDTPTLTQTYRYNDVYEAQLSGGPDVDGHNFAVQFGADGYGATAFTGAIKLDIGPGLAGNVSFDLSAGAHREPLLTSEGRAITFVKVDANTIRGYVASADNGGNADETIIEIKLTDTDASATTTLYGVIDHIAVQDGSQIEGIRVDATVAFSDGDGDVVTGIIRTTIHDDAPVSTGAITASTVLDDDAFAGNAGGAGDVLDATTVSGAASALFTIGADGLKSVVLGATTAFSAIYTDGNGVSQTEQVTWGNPTVVSGATTWIASGVHGDAATLTINADGSYTFTVLKPLAHPTSGATEETLTLTFNYTVTDGDNDVAAGSLTVEVNDDTPTLAQVYRYNDVHESQLGGGPDVDSHSFAVQFGADGYGATAFTGAIRLDIGPGLAGNVSFDVSTGAHREPLLTSEGRAITFVKVDANTIRGYVASADNGGNPDETIIEIKLTDTDASATTTLYGVIDHIAVQDGSQIDGIRVDATVAFSDGDGDVVTGIIRTTISDDVPTVAVIANQSVTETTASGFSNVFQAQSLSNVSLNISWGADDANPTAGAGAHDRSVAFAASLANAVPTGVTSNGFDLVYLLSSDGQTLTAYRYENGHFLNGAGADLGTSPSNSARIFSVSLSDSGSGSYSFTLYDNLDHASGAGANTLPLNFGFTATDSDGDATSGSFTVDVVDDVPLVTANAEEGAVDERYLDGPHPSTFGNLAIDWNADDRNVHLTFTSTTVTDDLGNVLALTSGGVALKYAIVSADGSTNPLDEKLIAYKDGDTPDNPVFTVNLIAAGNPSYQFVLYQALDHTGTYDDTLTLTFGATGHDGDGDAVTQSFTVTLEDWAPQSKDVDAKTIEEAAGSVSTGNVDIEIDFGADGDSAGASVTFVSAGPLTVKTQDGNAVSLTSLGVGLSYVLSADGATLTAYRFNGTDYISETGVSLGSDLANASDAAVFTVTLSDSGTGSYNFTLLQPLDHPSATGSTQQLTLNFGFRIEDADGDDDFTNSFSVIVDAAGVVSTGYTAPDSAVFVNMSETSQTVDGQTVAAHSVTDRASVTDRVVGLDRLGSITMADGGSADDILVGGVGDNKLFGNGGNDTLIGGGGSNTIQGGAGNDTIIYNVGSGGVDTVEGGSDTDTQIIVGTGGAETFNINAVSLGGISHVAANIGATVELADGANYEVATTAVEEWVVNGGGGGDTFSVTGALLGTGLATSTLHIDGGDGNDVVDLSGYAGDIRVVSDGGADADRVQFGFDYNEATYAKVFALDGVTLIGVDVTYNGVTSTFTNYESFVFTDGTRLLPALFNTAPVAQDDTIMASEDAPLTIDSLLRLLDNDSDIDGNTLTVTGVANATHGTVSLNNGNPIFTPDANFSGVAGFDYTVSDGNGGSATAHVTVDVAPKADAPVLSISSTNPTTAEEGAIDLAVGAALADLDGSETMTVSLGGVPSGFVLTDGQGHSALSTGAAIVVTGWTLSTLSLTPPSNYNGAFTVQVSATVTDSAVLSDGQTHTDVRTEVQSINVVVTPANDVPVAGADALSSVKEDSGVRIISFASLLGNDSAGPANESGQSLTITALSNVVGGTATISGTNILFTPAANFNGTASFDYTVQDNGQTAGVDDFKSNVGHASFTVTPVADAPVGTSNTVTATEDGAHVFTAAEFGFTDPLDSPANNFTGVVISTLPMAGTLTNHGVAVTAGSMVSIADINAGHLVYTPAANGAGDDYASFTFRVQDDGSVSGQGVRLEFQLASGWTGTSGTNYGWGTATQAPGLSPNQTAVAFAESVTGSTIRTDASGQPNAIATTGATYHLTFDHLQYVGYGAGTITIDVYAGTTLIGHFTHNFNAANPTVSYDTTTAVPVGEDGNSLSVVFTANSTFALDNVSLSQVVSPGVYGANLLVNGDFGSGSYYIGDNVDDTPKTMTIDVTPVNDLPVAVIDNPSGSAPGYTITEDTIWATFNAIGNDTLDPDAGAPNNITITAVTIPTNYIGITDSDLRVTVDPDNKIRVELLGADWQKLGSGSSLVIPISYTLHGDGTDVSTAQMMVRVTGVNDAPVLDVSKAPAITLAEDAGAPSFAGKVQVSSLVGFAGTAGIGNVTDDGYIVGIAITGANAANGTWSWSMDGINWSQINAASLSDSHALLLYGDYYVYFQPAAGFDGTVSNGLTIRAWDQSAGTPGSYANTTTNGGSTAFSSATDTVVVNVTGVDDPTMISGDTAGTIRELGGIANSQSDPLNGVARGDLNSVDPDSGAGNDLWQLVSVTGSDNGYGWYQITADGQWTYSLNDALPAIQALKENQATLTDSFTVYTQDGTAQTVTVQILGNNDAPTLQTALADQTSAEDQPFGFTIPANTFADADGRLDGTSNPLTYEAVLSDNSALPAWLSFDPATGTFSGTPPQDFVGSIDVKVYASDGEYAASEGFTLTVTPVNDKPALDLDGNDSSGETGSDYQASYTIGGVAKAIADVDSHLGDVDTTTMASAMIVLTNAQAGDALNLNTALLDGLGIVTHTVDTSVAGKITVTLGGSASLAAYGSAIESVTFSSTGASGVDRTVTVTVSDGSAWSDVATTTIDVTPASSTAVAQGDTISLVPTGWTWLSDNGHIYKFVGTSTSWDAAVSSAASMIAGQSYLATVTSAGEDGLIDSLVGSGNRSYLGASDAATDGTWVWATGPEAGQVLYMGGLAVNGAYTDWSGSGPSGTSPGGFEEDYLATDLSHFWNDVSLSGSSNTIGYTAEAGGGGTTYAAITEDAPFSFSQSWLLSNDSNAPAAIASVSSTSAKGAAVSYDALTGLITYNASGSTTLQHLAAGEATTDTFTYTIDDGNGGTSTATVTVNVQGVNDVPTGTNASLTVSEDVTRVLMLADFGYVDDDGDAMSGVTITSLSANAGLGQLLYGNVAVTVGQFISAADIAAGMLNFAPVDNVFTNVGSVSFGFEVMDSTGTSDATERTITIGFGNANQGDFTSPNYDSLVDVVQNAGVYSYSDAGGSDTLRIPNSNFATLTSLSFLRSDNNLEIGWASYGSNGYATVLNQYVGTNQFENFLFQSNASYGGVAIAGLYTLAQSLDNTGLSGSRIIAGTEASDSIYGGVNTDLMFGNGGHDTLYGNAGNDLLIGGLGNDRLEGGLNDDTYLFSLADGNDTIFDAGGTGDRIVIKTNGADLTGLNAHDTSSAAGTGHLMIQFNGQSVDVEAQYDGTGYAVNTINFDNGTVYGYTLGDYTFNGSDPATDADGFRTVSVSTGNNFIAGEIEAANKITGGSGADLIFGGDLADTLNGGGGNNLIVGGKGNDTLSASTGNDVFAFGIQDGTDTITDSSGIADAIFIDTNGAALSGLSAYDNNNGTSSGSLVIQYNGQQITVVDHFGGKAIERISFDGGSVDGYDLGTSIYTVRTDDPNSSGGARTVDLSFTSSDNFIAGEDGSANAITGGSARDLIFGGGHDDFLSGGEGSDLLIGGGGNDLLAGGSGNDTLRGGAGADTFELSNTGSSNFDTILDYSSAEGDTLDLSALLDAAYGPGNNVDASFVRLVNEGNDVKVQVDVDGATGGQNWADVALLQGYHTAGNTVLAQFENTTHTLTVAA
ncbi:tandem-95 repeat protein [Rhodopseudomonas palustris]